MDGTVFCVPQNRGEPISFWQKSAKLDLFTGFPLAAQRLPCLFKLVAAVDAFQAVPRGIMPNMSNIRNVAA